MVYFSPNSHRSEFERQTQSLGGSVLLGTEPPSDWVWRLAFQQTINLRNWEMAEFLLCQPLHWGTREAELLGELIKVKGKPTSLVRLILLRCKWRMKRLVYENNQKNIIDIGDSKAYIPFK